MFKIISKFLLILELDQKKKLSFLLLLSFVAAILEMLGLSLFIPIITSLNNSSFEPNIFTSNYLTTYLYNFAKSSNNIIFFFLIFLGIYFFFKTVFLLYFSKLISKYSANLYKNISIRIFRNYLNQDYNFYITRSSSELIQNLNVEVEILITRFFSSFVILINEFLIFFLISILLLMVSSITFILTLILFIFFFTIFILITKKLLKKWSFERRKYQVSSIKYVQEGIKNIKDIKVYGVEEKFFNDFDYALSENVKIQQNINVLSIIPKYIMELISIIIFIFIYWTLYLFNFSNQKIIIILTIFAAATLKLLPSINRIINSVVQINYSNSTLETIYREIILKNNYKITKLLVTKKKLTIKNHLLIKNLFFKYKNSQILFNNINLKIPLKKTIAIVGDSGAGKTTFIDIILGLIKPIKGNVLINNQNIFNNLKSWRNNISYVQQNSYFTQDTIKNNIAITSNEDFIDINRINYCLKEVGLSNFVSSLPKKINSRLSELANNLSGGQKQRLSIARALYKNPNILILDESTNSLDENAEIKLIKNIIDLMKDKTIFIITHKKSLLKYCDFIIDINKSKIKIRNN